MTAFADQLRSDLAARKSNARGAPGRQVEPCDAAAARLAEADRAADNLLAEIFRPLVDDFRGVLESLGVLDDGALVAEEGPRSPTAAVGRAAGGSGRKNKKTRRPDRQIAADYRAFLADRAARGLPPPSPGNPTEEMAEFHRFMAAARQREAAAGAADAVPQWRRLAYRAGGVGSVGGAGKGRRYEVRIAVSLAGSSKAGSEEQGVAACSLLAAPRSLLLELRCECLSGSLSDFRRDSAPALIELPRKRVASGAHAAYKNTDVNAARQWCQGVLGQSAAAIMEAEMGIDPAPGRGPAAVHAPLCAVPAAVDIDMPMMA